MISDAIPWREELLRVADRLEKKTIQRRWTERSGFLVERDVMTSAYAIRRLLEGNRISKTAARANVPVISHAPTGTRVDMYNRHEIWEHYDLEAGSKTQIGLRNYCNQLIHSFVWSINGDEDTGLFNGIFAASEKDCVAQLYFFPVSSIIDLCRRVGSEEIWGANVLWARDGTRYVISLSREEVEAERRSRRASGTSQETRLS